jgi:hypothetical protein
MKADFILGLASGWVGTELVYIKLDLHCNLSLAAS